MPEDEKVFFFKKVIMINLSVNYFLVLDNLLNFDFLRHFTVVREMIAEFLF